MQPGLATLRSRSGALADVLGGFRAAPASRGPGDCRPDVAAATAFPAATEAALTILRAGGNAVDAAVAAAWAISVCEPSGSGIGGQTTLLLHAPGGSATLLDGHSRAPAGVSLRRVGRQAQAGGRCATTVPSTPATLEHARRAYGRLPLARVLEPAIRLAEEGYALTRLQRRQLTWCWAALETSGSHAFFLDAHGRPLEAGDILRQPALARTLRRLAEVGVEDFYEGEIARAIAADMAEHGGLVTLADLAALGPPARREPLATVYRGHRVLSAPPPGGGLQVLQALLALERLAGRLDLDDEAVRYAALAGLCRATFALREHRPLPAEELAPPSRARLLGRALADELAEAACSVAPHAGFGAAAEAPGETTHLCVADADGTVVSLTQSIQSLFGAKVAHPTLGFFYNNYLRTCPRRPGHPARLGPGAVPRSNVAPTIVLAGPGEDDPPRLALGAAGSRRIVSSVLQVVANVVERGLPLGQAVAAPRIHGLAGGAVWVEVSALGDGLRDRLARRFGKVVVKKPHDYTMGAVQAIAWDRDGRLAVAADPRRDGFGRVAAADAGDGP